MATPHLSPSGGRRTVGRWALRTRLLGVLVVVGIIPFALVGWQAVRRVGQADLTAAHSRVEAASVSAGELIDRNLFERYGDVQAFAASPTVKRTPATAAEVTDTFTRLYGLYDLMVVTDAEGIVVAVNSVDHAGRDVASSQLVGRDLSAAPWFVAVRDGKVAADETWVEPPIRDQLVGEVYGDDRVTLPFSAAITGPDGTLAGVWHNEASFERVVDDIVASTQDDLRASGATTAEVQVVDGGDLLVQAHLFSGLDERSRDLPAELTDRPGASGQFDEVDDAGRDLVTGFAVTDGALGFPGYGWTILVSEERGAVLSGSTALARSLLVFGVLLSVAIVGVSFLVANRLAKPMGAAAGKARGAAHGLKAVADELIATSEETSQRASDIAASTEQLNTAISVIAIALDELTSSFTEVARSATEASGIAQDAVDVAERSTATVTELGRSSEAIEGVLAIIRSLSEQTNMLALNASIEASRAGESGRGFAVVADSVKELSEGTARATQEIAGLVGQIQGDVLAAIDANASIKEAVERIRNHSALIAEATDEQSGTAADVARITASATHDANEIANSNMVLADAAERSWTAANAMQTSADAVAGMASDLTAIVLGDHD